MACFLALLLYPTHCLLDSTIHRFLWIEFIFAHGFLKLIQFLLVGSIPTPSFPIPTTTVDEIANLFSHSFPSVITYLNLLSSFKRCPLIYTLKVCEKVRIAERVPVCVSACMYVTVVLYFLLYHILYMDVRVYCI